MSSNILGNITKFEHDTVDLDGRTPLSWATRNQQEGIVRALLERNDVNPNTADKYGETPLLWAAEYGQKGIVRRLLEQSDISPNSADKYGRTPLS